MGNRLKHRQPEEPSMQIIRTTVPGEGELHSIVTRAGRRLAIFVAADRSRRLITYDGASGVPAQTVWLEPDEADELADVLRSRPFVEFLLRVERRLDELTGEGRR
jgi:TrkA domain protein